MKSIHPNDILADLLLCRTSADALASRHQCSTYQLRAIMNRHKKDGLVTSEKLTEQITLWSLTAAGKDRAISLQPQTTN
jgi:hypothetical protein